MTWQVRYSKLAEKQLSSLPHETELRLRRFMEERVARLEKPRTLAVKLSDPYEDRFRYRVGDYKNCAIEDNMLPILVVEVAHRREVYR